MNKEIHVDTYSSIVDTIEEKKICFNFKNFT